ncbi:MAG: hypothetical protein EP347_06705 [Alphaproteobacteria bacterium]|nr:MAG: hypothetical protein EP347_06705 [Alphaproteobacteria bacterium]
MSGGTKTALSGVPDWDLGQSLPERFEAVVKAIPTVLALVNQEANLTFREFNNQANRLAYEFLAGRDQPTGRVGLVLNNGARFHVAAMAVLKAGKCYVPLDPAQPVERLSEYIARTGVCALVTDNRYLDLANQLNEASLPIFLAELCDIEADIDDPKVQISDEAEAFVIMTSGSTGAPKGVLHGHLGTLHNTMVTARELQLKVGDNFISMFTPAVFGAQRNIFLGLLSGATTHYIPVREVGFEGLGEYIGEHKIIGLSSVLTMFRRFIDTLRGDEDLSTLRFATCGGEPLYWTDVERFYNYLPKTCGIRGGLTMSESNMITNTWYGPGKRTKSDRVPLGKPAPDKLVELRREDGTLVEQGEVGEVFVTSKYIALGYLNAPEEIANRFTVNEDGSRTFATGDLARVEEDGNMVIVGRADHQVKLRGYRVDLSEVEQRILQNPKVAECVVKVHQTESGSDQLAAYVRMVAGGTFSIRELRDFVGQKLAAYMVPSHFILMQHIPQTASGKVHRQALTMPAEVSREGLGAHIGSRNKLDEWLIDVWQSWIGVKGIGIDDDFFEVGGDSLSATQLLMQIEETITAHIDAQEMLSTCNTVRKMSDYLAERDCREENISNGPDGVGDINFVDGPANLEESNRSDLYRLDKKSGLRIGRPYASSGKIQFNNLGFRGPDIGEIKPPGCLRIAFIGSSSVIDPSVSSNEHTWSNLLVEGLKRRFPERQFDYVNAGYPGYTTRRIQRLFEEFVAPLNPDIVIIRAGDMMRDLTYLAREKGFFRGLAYQPSWLARKSHALMLMEKNIVVIFRQIMSIFPWRKLEIRDDIADGYEDRLKSLIASCQGNGRYVILLECNRLREELSFWQQVRSLTSYCLYLPHVSLRGFLQAQKIYRRVRADVVGSMKCHYYDATREMPADNVHFADSSHFRDEGSKIFAQLLEKQLVKVVEQIQN